MNGIRRTLSLIPLAVLAAVAGAPAEASALSPSAVTPTAVTSAAVAPTAVTTAATTVNALKLTGTYTTATKKGTISWTAQRGFSTGYIGVFVIDGVTRSGVMYWNRAYPGSLFFSWSYSNGVIGMNAEVKQIDAATLSGPITFYNSRGAVTGTGTVTLH